MLKYEVWETKDLGNYIKNKNKKVFKAIPFINHYSELRFYD